ncbi:MAG: hypothetical protein K2X55_25770 [Burkholderiaceae bacterium]|nr:hypothetical protein [Burkholderiaceae bacterium]
MIVVKAWQELQRRPRLVSALVIAAVVSLPLSYLWWSKENAAYRALQADARRAAALQPLGSQVQQASRNWQALQIQASAAQQQLQQAGVAMEGWARRSIAAENQKMSRADADVFLRDLYSSQHTLFFPSVVDVKANVPGESIFAAGDVVDRADAVIVNMKAELYTRGAQ